MAASEDALRDMLDKIRDLPPMTPKERIRQKIDFVWGNAAASTHHQQSRLFVAAVAWEHEWEKLVAAARAVTRGLPTRHSTGCAISTDRECGGCDCGHEEVKALRALIGQESR